jgi:site-specific DNA-methyltransferase (adenine-specific)
VNDMSTRNETTSVELFAIRWRYWRTSQSTLNDVQQPQLPRRTILVGDALTRLREVPRASVDCSITSPPYFLLRDYGTEGQLGLERDVDQWVENLRAVLAEVARVLKPTGSLWLNLGDSFSRADRFGAAPKSLLLAPER